MHSKYLIKRYCPSDAQTIEKRECISLTTGLSLIFLFSIIIDRSKSDSSEVEMFFFLDCNSKGYIFLKPLSNFWWSLLGHKLSIKLNVLLKGSALRKSLYLVSNRHLLL